jgi:hypothetical protein
MKIDTEARCGIEYMGVRHVPWHHSGLRPHNCPTDFVILAKVAPGTKR